MIKINHKLADILLKLGAGIVCEFGAVVGDKKFIVYYPDENDDVYLAHISEFEQEGFLIRLKERKR